MLSVNEIVLRQVNLVWYD